MNIKQIPRLLSKNGLLKRIKRAGIKEKPLYQLLAQPPYSPNHWKSEMQVKLHKFKREKNHLARLALNTGREIETLLLSLQDQLWRALIPAPDVAKLVADLNAFAAALKAPAGASPLSTLLGGPSSLAKGRPPQTSSRDHRIWQLAYLFKKASGSPHYELVAEVMNAVHNEVLGVDQVKKAISRHPEERTYYPTQLKHIAPMKVLDRRAMVLKGARLYGPPGKIFFIAPDGALVDPVTGRKRTA
jgi:hypothetical protein